MLVVYFNCGSRLAGLKEIKKNRTRTQFPSEVGLHLCHEFCLINTVALTNISAECWVIFVKMATD